MTQGKMYFYQFLNLAKKQTTIKVIKLKIRREPTQIQIH